jgi:hypothetical protein
VAFLIVVGGLGGLFVHSFKPALYEATAQFSIGIDYASTGPLSQYDQDLAINAAGHLFGSDQLLLQIVDQAGKEGLKTTLNDLKNQIALDRQFSSWNIRVRDPDPDVARRIATIWIVQGEALLQQSYQSAVQAYRLERYIQSQENCLEKYGASEPSDQLCGGAYFTDVQANLRDAGIALHKEKAASLGLFAGLTFGPFNPPEVSPQPVTLGRSQYVLLGGLLGLLLGIGLIEMGAPMFGGMRS